MSKLLAKSFAGGEITPELYGRIDLTKRQTGLTQAVNFWILPYGPAQNRPGFGYLLNVKDSSKQTRVYEFEFNTEQTYIVEFGDLYIRFHTNGGTVVEAATTITAISQANPGIVTDVAHPYLDGDWVFLTSIVGMVELNGRFVIVRNPTANTYELEDLFGNTLDTTTFGAYISGGTAARVFELVSTYTEAELFQLTFTQNADVLSIAHPSHDTAELTRLTASSFALADISFVPTVATPGPPVLVTGGPGGGTPITISYKATALADVTLEESLGSATATTSFDLTVAGNFVDVTPATVPGAVRYNIYKLKSGLFGFIGQTEGGAVRDNNIDPDVSQTPPTANTPFAGVDNKPAAVGYAEGRRVFAGTNNAKQDFFLTRSASESNLSYSIPTRDDDSIQGRILAQKVNRIRHIVPLDRLVFLTSGGAWIVAPENSDILTPSTVFPRQRAFEGASQVRPLLPAYSAIYVHNSGDRIQELRFTEEAGGLASIDASIMAPHLFDGFTITDAAYTKAPNRICWFTRSDGVLLGMTYLPEHKVLAWHQHNTADNTGAGAFESLASVKEGTRDVLYTVVKRFINGQTVRYIERSAKRAPILALKDAIFLDSFLTFSGAPSSTITGLHHLEGETVSILADGSVHPTRVVVNGTITLDDQYSTVHVGLPIIADFETLPLAVEGIEAAGQGTKKNICEAYLRVYQSSGIFVGPDVNNLRERPPRSTEPYGSPPELKSEEFRIGLDAKWTTEGTILVRQVEPLPLTVLSITLGAEAGG